LLHHVGNQRADLLALPAGQRGGAAFLERASLREQRRRQLGAAQIDAQNPVCQEPLPKMVQTV
jgi:hypothetical protein